MADNNEPSSGRIDLAHRLNWLVANGYQGSVGLEYRPLKPGGAAVKAAITALGL
jgi:hydroxypyruvate isomerase